jgi:hypothetical protein
MAGGDNRSLGDDSLVIQMDKELKREEKKFV